MDAKRYRWVVVAAGGFLAMAFGSIAWGAVSDRKPPLDVRPRRLERGVLAT